MKKREPNRWVAPLLLAGIVGSLWCFPAFWYHQGTRGPLHWFREESSIPGWDFQKTDLSESAEKLLVADHTVNGEFIGENHARVRVFSAKRYREKSNEIGLFVHTPDRCWVETGWKIEPAAPSVRDIELGGVRVPVERRIFSFRGRRELVYFFGLVAGEPLPYRLDHNLSAGARASLNEPSVSGRSFVRGSDAQFWARLWESFIHRRELFGPKQFVRVSTPLGIEDLASADARLETFLRAWLKPADYEREKSAWESGRKQKGASGA